MGKRVLWMLISSMSNSDIHLVIPTIAWMAKEAKVEFECYLEASRNGKLFAASGSTILGGYHFEQFNYLNSVFEVKYILFGETSVFRSTLNILSSEILIETSSLQELYETLLKQSGIGKPGGILIAPPLGEMSIASVTGTRVQLEYLEIGPYLYTEIYFRRALAFPVSLWEVAEKYFERYKQSKKYYIYLSCKEKKKASRYLEDATEIDSMSENDTYSTVTLRIARRWKHLAKGVAFGDPMAILSILPTLCREERIALYGELKKKPLSQIKVAWYTESSSEIAAEVAGLAEETGNRVIIGRQTGDGDLFEWSKKGICMKIIDPNRPAFPVVTRVKHPWTNRYNAYEDEVDDETLLQYAKSGKILASLIWHSGEMAHNEAMLNLIDLVSFTGIKMGIGVHAARYETCPQLWELINVPKEKGGVKGYIEPIIHSGGMGVMAEINCPVNLLKQHCEIALARIRQIAGDEAVPRGYYAFADTDLDTMMTIKSEIYEAIEESGLEYFISSVRPGRNRIIYLTDKMIVVNQSSRTHCSGSPFVRITTIEDIKESGFQSRPGWFIGTLDSPVISFNPYIWRYGSRFMQIVDWMLNAKDVVNVTPHTIARYARILKQEGFLA